MRYIMGVDLGTSATKTVLFDEAGVAVASASAEYPLYQPRNGWAEQDPDDWWDAAKQTISAVLKQSGVDARDIAGVGISGQMHGLVLLDKDGQPLRRAILWCDGRTQAECDQITQIIGGERLIQISANPALTGFTAGKILWVRSHEPQAWAATRHILLPKDYVRYKLTGELFAEMSDASGTNLMDVPRLCWSEEILSALDIPLDYLPPLINSCDKAGCVTSDAAAQTGLAQGTALAAGAGDNAAAAVGMGVVKAGRALATIGTSGVVYAHSDTVQIDPAGRVHTFCAAVPGQYAVMSCSLAAGLSLQWFRNALCDSEMAAARQMGVDVYELLSAAAAQSPLGANGLIYLPYLMGERSPLLDSDARGAFIGLTASHQKRDLLRAVMEGVTHSLWQNLDILRGMRVVPRDMLACGGGAKSPFWRQMMADMFAMPVRTSTSAEAPALGAGILAGVAVGLYRDIPSACDRLIGQNPPLAPIAANTAAYAPFHEVYEALYPALKASYKALSALR